MTRTSLKQIAVSELRLGMFLQKLDGPWIDHPFWRARFVIKSDADLELLRSSAIETIWIDLDKGEGGDAPGAADTPPAEEPGVEKSAAAQTGASRRATVSMADELDFASALYKRARTAVATLYRETREERTVSEEKCRPLVAEITGSVLRQSGALVSLVRLKAKEDYLHMHSVAVCTLMVALAKQLGHDDDACRDAGMAGLLHDIGKAVLRPSVLSKVSKLTPEEYAHVRSHPQLGHALLVKSGVTHQPSLDVCLHHHERIDGAGYPMGLHDAQISTLAKMGAVCDIYDALTSDRPYRAGQDPAAAISRMASWTGHLDPHVFAAFVKGLGVYPIGALVRLESGKLAVVVEQNPQTPTRPIVRVFYSTRSDTPLPTYLLDLGQTNCPDSVAAREPLGEWKTEYIDKLWAGDAAPRRG